MKHFLTFILFIIIVFTMTACSHTRNYTVLTSLDDGSAIQIKYNDVVYTQTGDYNGNFPGERIFHLNYGEICSTVAYDVYIDGDSMYLKAQQPFWADMTAVCFVLTADNESADNK